MKIKDIEKKYNIRIWKDSNMKVSTYIRKIGFPSLANILENK